jgi:hypothetical protein
VQFHDRELPVCGMHSAMYERWGKSAEENAALYWAWEA